MKAKTIKPDLYDGLHGTARLDMIDPAKGYVEGNVQWIHKDIQAMKGDFSTLNVFAFASRSLTTSPNVSSRVKRSEPTLAKR
jgi:hypothetical protein